MVAWKSDCIHCGELVRGVTVVFSYMEIATLIMPIYPITPPYHPLPWLTSSSLTACSFNVIFLTPTFYIWQQTCDTHLSEPNLTLFGAVISVCLQMTWFYSPLWLHRIPFCAYRHIFISVHLWNCRTWEVSPRLIPELSCWELCHTIHEHTGISTRGAFCLLSGDLSRVDFRDRKHGEGHPLLLCI